MDWGICNLSVIPLRRSPADSSEMVSQILFGETFEILETKNQWRRIITHFDAYEGWIDEKQFAGLSESDHKKFQDGPLILTTEPYQKVVSQNEVHFLHPGSVLRNYIAGEFSMVGKEWTLQGKVRNCSKEFGRNLVIETATSFLNTPYLWGGRTHAGIDCSGLTQICYKLAGKNIMRDAEQQARQGTALGLLDEAAPGDLAFFENPEGKILHTGILLINQKILHASGRVRIDKIDQHGIFNAEKKSYTHRLRLVKNYFS